MKKLHHLCIQTDNYKKSMDFYCEILGFEIVKETKDFHSRAYNTWLELEGLMLELQTGKSGEDMRAYSSNNKGLVHFCFVVDDIDKEYELMVKKGYDHYKLKNGEVIYTVEGGKLFKVIAPEGTIIEFRDSENL